MSASDAIVVAIKHHSRAARNHFDSQAGKLL